MEQPSGTWQCGEAFIVTGSNRKCKVLAGSVKVEAAENKSRVGKVWAETFSGWFWDGPRGCGQDGLFSRWLRLMSSPSSPQERVNKHTELSRCSQLAFSLQTSAVQPLVRPHACVFVKLYEFTTLTGRVTSCEDVVVRYVCVEVTGWACIPANRTVSRSVWELLGQWRCCLHEHVSSTVTAHWPAGNQLNEK